MKTDCPQRQIALDGRFKRQVVATCLLMLSSLSHAGEYALGGGFLGTAALEASAVRADNYFYQSSNTVSANGYRVRPSLSTSRTASGSRFTATSYLEQADFDLRGRLDRYLDYGVDTGLSIRPFTRHSFDLSADFRRGHDPAGLQRTEQGQPDFSRGEIDLWNQGSGSFSYRYGSPESLGSNTLRALLIDRRYTTNRASTAFLDYRVTELGYELAYEYSPKTAFTVNMAHRATDYGRATLPSFGNRNGNEFSVRGGIRWAATAKTSGDIQLGVREYWVDGRGRPARQALSWRANIAWTATPSTELKLNTGRTTNETFRADTLFIDDRSVGLSWQQTWTTRLNTRLSANFNRSEFVPSNRKDNLIAAAAGFDFLLSRRTKLFGEYLSRNRDSSSPTLDYDAPEARLGFRWSL